MCTNPVQLAGSSNYYNCGKCIECCMLYSSMWAQRCVDEAKLHSKNCMITLTYERTDYELHKEDLQKFIKRLRRKLEPIKIRYYACGEYGSRRGRPHYHVIIFGWFPDDAKLIKEKGDEKTYGSKFLEEVWRGSKGIWNDSRKGGFVSVADVSYKTARYVCKYLQKLDKREHKVNPFTVMSRKPGIGAHSVCPDMLLNGLMYINGKSFPIPKFYLDKLQQMGYNVDIIKAKRQYIYQNRYGSFTDAEAVDSAKKRGEVFENRLRKMEGV